MAINRETGAALMLAAQGVGRTTESAAFYRTRLRLTVLALLEQGMSEQEVAEAVRRPVDYVQNTRRVQANRAHRADVRRKYDVAKSEERRVADAKRRQEQRQRRNARLAALRSETVAPVRGLR